MVVEVVAGLLAGSIALLSDAAHMLTDAASIALALVAAGLAARPATGQFTFGWRRAEVLSAAVNGAALLVLGVVLGVGAVQRLFGEPEVDGGVVLAGPSGARSTSRALARTCSPTSRLAGGDRGRRGRARRRQRAGRPLAALVVVGLMLRSGTGLLRSAGRILLEATPAGLDTEQVGMAMAREKGVSEVHDLHLGGHLGLPGARRPRDGPARRGPRGARRLQRMLTERFDVRRVTLQVEHGTRHDHAPLQISPSAR